LHLDPEQVTGQHKTERERLIKYGFDEATIDHIFSLQQAFRTDLDLNLVPCPSSRDCEQVADAVACKKEKQCPRL